MELQLSRHAAVRANQRGVPHAIISQLLELADVETPVGGGCIALSISRRRLAERDIKRRAGPYLDRLRKLAIVCDGGDGSVVTVLHEHAGRGRRYHRA